MCVQIHMCVQDVCSNTYVCVLHSILSVSYQVTTSLILHHIASVSLMHIYPSINVTSFCVFLINLPGGAVAKNLSANVEDTGDSGSTPGPGRSPWMINGNPLQYSCLENSLDRRAWLATVCGVPKSQTRLRDRTRSFTEFSRLCSMWSLSLLFYDYGFHSGGHGTAALASSVCPLMDEDKRPVQVSWLTGKGSDAGKDKTGGETDERGWGDWVASLAQWTWVWANSGRWWRTGKPNVLQSMWLQRVRHDLVTEQ